MIRLWLCKLGLHRWEEYELDFFNLYRVQEMCLYCMKRRERVYAQPKKKRCIW